MSKKYYRVIKENFMWEVGAILEHNPSLGHKEGGYEPVEDVWNKQEDQTEYISAYLIEKSPEFFERVYTNDVEKVIFKTKEELKNQFNKMVK